MAMSLEHMQEALFASDDSASKEETEEITKTEIEEQFMTLPDHLVWLGIHSLYQWPEPSGVEEQ